MITFFYSTQTCSTAVHIALEEAGIPFKGVEVSWKRKVNIAELEAVNPLAQVPTIVDEKNRSLNQCIAILEYIADNAKEKNLLPAPGTWERTSANAWLAFIGADLQKSFGPLFWASRWTNNTEAQTAIKTATLETIHKYLKIVDQALAGKDYLLGKDYSVVDSYLFTIVGWCKWSEIKIGHYSNLSAYMKRVYNRPAVQKVLAKEEMLDILPA